MSRFEVPKKKIEQKQGNWVLNKLEENPIKYGSDDGSINISKDFLKEFYNIEVTSIMLSQRNTIEREKNKILENREDLDFRIKHARKKEKYETKPFSYFLKEL